MPRAMARRAPRTFSAHFLGMLAQRTGTAKRLQLTPLPMSEITPEIVEQHGLSPEEYERVLAGLGREPNLVELGIFSVMW